jgi:DNA repair exonuclease SbcCD ATPase subunit
MILRRLAVEGWRCFANRFEIGPLSDGVNVLHGPNSSGKSTLMGALVRGLFDNHAGSAQAIKALRPWGRTLSPTVSIEFEHAGETYSLDKRFLQGSRSELSRLEGGRMVRLAEGADANEKVREMLCGEAPARGETNLQHWGIAQVLWAPQQGIALTSLSSGMTAAIQQALGATLRGSSKIEDRVADRYFRIYTPGGSLIGGANSPPAVAMGRQLKEAQQRRTDIEAKLRAYDEASRRAEDFRNRRDQSLRDCQRRQQDLDAARLRSQQYREAEAACGRHQAAATAAEARYTQLQSRVENLKTTRKELIDVQEETARTAGDLYALRRQEEQCRIEADRAESHLDRIRARRPEVDTAEERASQAARYLDQHRRLSETDDLLRRIDAAIKREAELREQRLALAAPSASQLQSIRNVVARRDQAQIQLDAALITVRIIPERSLTLEVARAEQPGDRTAAAGQVCEIKGSPDVSFHIAGVGDFRATGPTGSAGELRQRIADASRQIVELTAAFGTQDLDALQSLHAQAAAIDSDLGSARSALAALLGGRQPDDIRRERAALAAGVEAVVRAYTQWAETLPDAEALRTEAMRIRDEFVRDVEQAEARQKQAQQALSLARQDLAGREASVRGLQQRAAAARQRLDALAGDGKDDAQREADLQRMALEWHAAKAQLEEAQQRLRDLGVDPAREVQILEEQVRHLQKSHSEFDASFNREQGSLLTLASEAPYSALADVDERIARLEADIAREQLYYDAVRLLHDRIDHHRRTLNQQVLGPVTERATGMLQRIAGLRLGSLELGSDFLPAGVTPEEADGKVEIEELCGGEREQVYLAVRLALAEVLFRDQRQLVVLDDALTYTDAGRFARILAILEEAAAHFQILILTCHPERYSGLSEACFIDIEGR